MACPVSGCKSVFITKTSFTSHMPRKHRHWSENVKDARCECPTSSATIQKAASVSDDEDTVGDGCNFSYLYLRNICLFYMKLQGQHLLTVSTNQNIIEEMQNIHELGQANTMNQLNLLLKVNTSIPDEDIVKISDTIKQSHLFAAFHTGPMRTAYSKTQCFKDKFTYVEPRKIMLGRHENRTEKCAYYVPVLKTLNSTLESGFWQGPMSVDPHNICKTDFLSDSFDGKVFMSNTFFQENPNCLKLVLYQNAFEVVNPLRSAKKKHKVLAVYFSLLNMTPHVQSNVDHMQVVLLCTEKDFKNFGHAKVFSEMLTDLKELEENGITIGDELVVKGALYCIAGDNLGSHTIGVFTENFS